MNKECKIDTSFGPMEVLEVGNYMQYCRCVAVRLAGVLCPYDKCLFPKLQQGEKSTK